MKIKHIAAVLVMAVFLPVGQILAAEGLSAIDAQEDFLMSESRGEAARVTAVLEIMLPEYPSVGKIVFDGEEEVPVHYLVNENSITVNGAELPLLYSELKDIPRSMQPLTIVIGVNDKTVTAEGRSAGDAKISPIDLRIALYNEKRGKITDKTKPKIEGLMKDIMMNIEDIDESGRTISMFFSTKFPVTGDSLYDSILANKTVEGDLFIEY